MNWITNRLPDETGTYLISVNRRRGFGGQAFKYVGHFDFETKKWFKYDPFDDNYEPTEEIDGEVPAWTDELGVFMK